MVVAVGLELDDGGLEVAWVRWYPHGKGLMKMEKDHFFYGSAVVYIVAGRDWRERWKTAHRLRFDRAVVDRGACPEPRHDCPAMQNSRPNFAAFSSQCWVWGKEIA